MKSLLAMGICLMLVLPVTSFADYMDLDRLTYHADWDTHPTWSSDGIRIAFSSNRAGSNDIWAMDAIGGEDSNLVQVTTDGFLDRNPCYEPDADSIVFASYRNGGGLFKVAASGGTIRRITIVNSDDNPAFSRAGDWIVFQSLRLSTATEIYKMEDPGGEPTLVRLTLNAYYDDAPVFSPNGESVAFSSDRDGNFEIFSMDARGESHGIEQLTFTDGDINNRGPAYSPDGYYIAFSSTRDGNDYDLYYMDARGEPNGIVRLTEGNGNNGGVEWSPVDNDRIAFNSNRIVQAHQDIYVGYNLRTIGVDEGTISLMPHNYELFQNYPNPFNPSTNIHFALPKTEQVSIKVYNLMGQEVSTLIDEKLDAGTYDVKFNGQDYSSGIYFYVLKAGDFTKSRKMTLLK